jgi:hypothetical protein
VENAFIPAKAVILGFPVETVYPESMRDSLLARVIKFFKNEPTGGILNTFQPFKNFELYGNYPNPFNSQTIIRFFVPEDGELTLSIFNLLGQEVINLRSGFILAGEHAIRWDAFDQPSGIYFINLNYTRMQETENTNFKITLLR